MELSGNYVFEANQQAVWDLLMDPDAIAQALPGVKGLIPIEGEENAWRAEAKLQVASIGGTYAGIIRMTEIQPMDQYRLTVGGEGQQSIINGTCLIRLSTNVEKQVTELDWVAEASISGKLAGVGQRLIGATANLMSKRFFKALADQLDVVR